MVWEKAHNTEPINRITSYNVCYTKLLRLLVAAAVALVAWLNGPAYWLFGVAAVIAFTAVYDRCPVYKVVKLQVQQLKTRRR